MSCRVIKNKEPHHILTIKGDHEGDIVLVGPNRCYLSCHGDTNGHVSISGAKTLRALANAILDSLPKLSKS